MQADLKRLYVKSTFYNCYNVLHINWMVTFYYKRKGCDALKMRLGGNSNENL